MTVLHVQHRTTYVYKKPVEFGEHRLMSRPRDSHDLRLLDTTLTIDPPASALRWIHDVFGNSIAIATFGQPAERLVFESGFRAEHFPTPAQALDLENYATRFPFNYAADDAMDLAHTRDRHYDDPEHKVDVWAKELVEKTEGGETLAVLTAMTAAIKQQFKYVARDAVGVQSPLETLRLGSGSCRDFAVFMMEAARYWGFGARFVTGYIQMAEGQHGATHAWTEIYIPGAGWRGFDPTNNKLVGSEHIPVGVSREQEKASPLSGSWEGPSDAFDRMTVSVQVVEAT